MQTSGTVVSREAYRFIKRHVLSCMLLVLLGPTAAHAGRLQDLREEVSEVKVEVDAIRNEVAFVQEKLSALGNQIYDLQEQIAALEHEQRTANQKAESLLTQFRELSERHRELLEATEAARRPPARRPPAPDPLQGVWKKKVFAGLFAMTLIFDKSGNFIAETEVPLSTPDASRGTWKRSGQNVEVYIEKAPENHPFEVGENWTFEILSIEGDVLVIDDGTEPLTLKRVGAGNG